MDLPIVCTLTETELQERRQTVLAELRDYVLHTRTLNDGYAYEFAMNAQMIERLSQVVALESQCCRFLNFRIVVEAGSDRVRFEVTGQEGTRELIDYFFTPNPK